MKTDSPFTIMPPFKDLAMSTRVKSALLSDRVTRRCAISVIADDGTVTLVGEVAEPAAATHAQRLAESIPGVRAVSNLLASPSIPAGTQIETSPAQRRPSA
ncbi:MAG TPA: BON domain-containing protein [Candidatus Binataceae bacterium]